jgi:beta-phosphoglucomutase-like phosphatase (HAD superfamily)
MLIPALLPYLDQKARKGIADRHGELFQSQFLPQVKAFHQAAALIAKLHADRTQVLLAPSAKDAEVEHYVRLLDVQRALTAATSADDVANSKPAGDIFASALRKVTPIQAEEAIAIGDTPYDVLAAGRPRTTVAKRIEARRTLD